MGQVLDRALSWALSLLNPAWPCRWFGWHVPLEWTHEFPLIGIRRYCHCQCCGAPLHGHTASPSMADKEDKGND